MSPEEYWSTIWEVVSDHFTVVQEDLKTREGVQIEVGSVPDNWKRGVYLIFPVADQTSEFNVALRAPAKVGGIVLWPPNTLNDALTAGGIGIKNHWYEGEIYYEKKQSLEDYKLFHRPLNKLIVGWADRISDSGEGLDLTKVSGVREEPFSGWRMAVSSRHLQRILRITRPR